ncbi:MAG: nuclear transport factor 2 family protein [Proteobacteria bacterium]|nr:nuclear transport factor 2 family protein [Pseudomonadota bacterium]MBS0494338.1 nuclear transport factor 2 family protein [Pseudomonadota bacterium]
MELTEKEAAITFARAWNRLDATEFLALLAPDAKYASQWVFEELQSKEAIVDYLRAKMKTVKVHAANNPQSKVRVEIGITQAGDADRPCAYMKQGANEAVIVFTVNDGMISRYDLCIPQLYRPDRSGVYPI